MNRLVRTASGAMALVFCAVSGSIAQQIQVNKDNRTITITASDQAEALADTAVLTVGFHLYGKDQDGTYAEASKTSNAVMAAVMAAGVPKAAIESVNQSLGLLNPIGDADKARYAGGIRFVFWQSWRVTLSADAVANVLNVAIAAGANESGGIYWMLKKDNALEAEAAKKALEHARQIAAQMAEGLGVKLGALVYASNQTPPQALFAGMGGVAGGIAGMGMGSAGPGMQNLLAPLAISPEKITKSATVYAVFAIE